MTDKKPFKTSIGGQALIEGVMMRGPDRSAMAVRTPEGTVETEIWENSAAAKRWYRKTPFVRGVFNMVDSLMTGYKCLMRSATIAGMEDDEEPSRFEKWISAKLGKNLTVVISALALILGVGIALFLFTLLPAVITGFIGRTVGYSLSPMAKSLCEGVLKIFIFLLYLFLVARMNEIRRVFEYHGAEHKTIACYESGEELTIENVRPKTRFHPRCGTSFLLIVMVISILVFSVVTWDSVAIRVLLKIALLPVVIAISYEIIKFAGRHDNPFTRFISAPGMWLQRLTTNEPDDSQIEIAIASMMPVIPEEGAAAKW